MAEAKVHLNADGTPIKTEKAAQLAQGRLKAKGIKSEIITYDDGDTNGFALQETEAQATEETPPVTATQETQAPQPETASSEAPVKSAVRPDRLARKRKMRAELGARSPLDARVPPGYRGYWELDNEKLGGQSLQKRINVGWDFVRKEKDGKYTAVSGDVGRASGMGSLVTMPAGGGGTLYLMVIELELYKEDREAYDAKLDEIDDQMQRDAVHPDIQGTGMTIRTSTPQVLQR